VHRYIIWPAVALALALAVYVAEPYFVPSERRPAVQAAWPADRRPSRFTRRSRANRLAAGVSRIPGRHEPVGVVVSALRAEMPDLQRLAEAEAGRGIAVVGVNEGESPQRARAFADSLGIHFPIWVDGAQQYGRTYNALGLPTTVILDRQGVVIRAFDGPLTLDGCGRR